MTGWTQRLGGLALALSLAAGLDRAAAHAPGAAPAPDLPAAERIELSYDVYAAGFPVLSLRLDVVVDGARYRVAAELATRGLLGVLFPWTMRATSDGTVEPDRLRPVSHRTESTVADGVRTVALAFAADGGIAAAVEPPATRDDRDPVPEDLARHALDPLTAVLSMVRRVERDGRCDGSAPVYDGRRRYDLVVADEGSTSLRRVAEGVFSGPARRCAAAMRRIAGFWKKDTPWNDGADERAATIYLGRLEAAVMALPVRLDLETPIGLARAVLASARVDGRPVRMPPRP